jgi:hypothetical protein
VVHQGVTILGPANLPSEVAYDASQMFSKNVTTFLMHLLAGGKIQIDRRDEITAETLVTLGGRVVHPRVCEALGVQPPGQEWKPASAGAKADLEQEKERRETPDVYGIQSNTDRSPKE